MANRSSFSLALPRDLKRLINLVTSVQGYEKRVSVDALDKNGNKVSRFVIRKDYDNELRSLFIEAHAHHRKWHNAMLSQKSNVDVAGEEPAEEVSTT